MSKIVTKIGNKNATGVVVSKTQQIPLTKQFTVNPTTTPPATAQLIAPAIMGSFDDSSDVRIRIDSIYSKQDIGKNDSCARIPLYTWNNTTPHTVKYSQASPPYGVSWSNIKPSNWSDMVDYLNENNRWSKSNAYLKDSLSIGYVLSAWSASNHYQIDGTPYGAEHSVAHNRVFVTNFSGHTSDSRINALFDCKVKAFNTNQYNSVYYNIEPYTYGEGVKIDFKDNTFPKVTVGFEGILSGAGLDSMINEYSQDTVKSMFVVGFKGGWTSAGGNTHYGSYGYLKNKIYSLQDGNPFTITKRKLRDNVWYFESKDHVTFEDRETVQHTKGEDVPEIDLYRNQIVAFAQNGFTGLDPYTLAWYVGPTAANEITLDYSDSDYRFYNTFVTLFDREYTDENTWQHENIAKFPNTASMKAVLDKITAYFATAPSTGIIHTFPNGSTWVVPCFSTDNILYEAQETVHYYQAPVPPNDYVEYEDLCLNQPLFFMTPGYPSENSTGTCFSNNQIYYITAVNPKPAWMVADPGYYLYCGAKDHFDSAASAWIKINTDSSSSRELNKATLFYEDLGEENNARTITARIWGESLADDVNVDNRLRNYHPSFNILNFPWGTSAQWLALNYTFSCK